MRSQHPEITLPDLRKRAAVSESARRIPAEARNRAPASGVFDLDECLRRVAGGDEQAARALVERCHPLVARLVRAHRPRTLGEDDLEQEVFLKMFAMLPRYEAREGQLFEHWLARLCVRTCRDLLRGERRRAENLPLSSAAQEWLGSLAHEAQPTVEDAHAARELVEHLLAQLPPQDRLVLTLLDLEQRSTSQIAALTGWSRALVKVRAFRARLRLRAIARERKELGDG
ncbi:MAG: sigma-70 family RNA polymerase sigma factor [Planctomycetes bacterium]|nr:sigma-70 family RNA polymerase sigma factor [Planctomycetota bacterium]